MRNINIKAVFIEEGIADKNIINAFEKGGASVFVTNTDELKHCVSDTPIPVFNHCAVGGKKFIDTAKQIGIRALTADKKLLNETDIKTFLECGRPYSYEIDEEAFTEKEIDCEDTGHMESVFALGNGYLGLRGTYDERDELIKETSGMYINGIFETEPIVHPWPCKGFAKNEEYTVNLCDWRIIEVYIDGEKACFSNGLNNHIRRLDFTRGETVRCFEFTSKSGKSVKVESVRIVSLNRPHSAQIRYTVTSANFDGEIEIHSSVIKNTLINGKKATYTVKENVDKSSLMLETSTIKTNMHVAASIEHNVNAESFSDEYINNENSYTYIVRADIKCKESVIIVKYAAFYSCEDKTADICDLAMSETHENMSLGFDRLRSEQSEAWKKHWEYGDIKIDGNKADQQAVRFSMFHLRSQLPTVNNASIGATGLTGPNYSGKVFWDTEMYLMPYYLFTDPEKCKGLIMYRVKLLDKARKRAKEIGNDGALYSWCSIDGEETSVVFEASTAEYHINADIAYAVWRYEKATGDSDFVYENCAEMIFETAKFYAHRGTFVEAHDGRFCINSVCGPDEYACGVNNNCYTNFMVQFHLRYALKIFADMKKKEHEKLNEIINKISLDDNELKLWREAANKMYYKINEKYGIYEQDDRFVYNDAVDMETIPKNYDIRHLYHPLDLWRIQVLKQADVVLLQFILGDRFTLDEKKRNYDYYEPKTNHGSSLSAAIHSIMANEIGYADDAYEYFRSGAYMDIGDFKKNTDGGIHIACHGGVWMSVINGFLGMRLYDGGLHFKPDIPKQWGRVQTKLIYRGARIEISADENSCTFTLINEKSVKFTVHGEEAELTNSNRQYVYKKWRQNKTTKEEYI